MESRSSNKWWDRWHKSRFSDPLHPEAFNFFPGLDLIASKLKISSIKGFLIMFVALVVIYSGFRLILDFYYEPRETNTEEVIQAYQDLPELRPAIILMVLGIVAVVLVLWWWRHHHEDRGVWETKT